MCLSPLTVGQYAETDMYVYDLGQTSRLMTVIGIVQMIL
jgi:hypothetical protein